jgi:hypothetical protein
MRYGLPCSARIGLAAISLLALASVTAVSGASRAAAAHIRFAITAGVSPKASVQ